MKFNPCTGKCTQEGTHCEGCGRSHEEIAGMKAAIEGVVDFAQKMGYENIDEFTDGVVGGVKYMMGNRH
ncbi:MAG: DUF1289 domain-containing protein [Gammaproteobacteria bacterium]|nr:DUF1289 domain-containing protein [Gammaproteobacteria bacterium]